MQRFLRGVRCFVALGLLSAVLVFATPSAGAAWATLTGVVACREGHTVAGVWIEYQGGGGKWATMSTTSAPWVAKYSASITVPKSVQLHIGCGKTSSGAWWSNNRTPFKSVSGTAHVSATCKEASGSPAQRCSFWGSSLLVGMPMSGTINKYNYADVKPGAHPIYTSGGWADWSTDVYAAAGTAVRPRVYAPSSSYTLKISRLWTGCAGKGVGVGVYKGSAKVGELSYAHLDAVPAFSIGQQVSTSTVLGKLKLWPKCSSWQVSSSGGVHTHMEVGTEPGKACYRANMSTKTYKDTFMVGIITPGATANCA